MGLDVFAYKKISKALDDDGNPLSRDAADEVGMLWTYHNGSFPGRADDVEDRCAYACEDSLDVISMGYGGYNHWRNELAELVGWPETEYEHYGSKSRSHAAGAWEAESGPLWELINFADNEGVLGTATCAKLAKEFAENQLKADAHPDEQFRKRYKAFREGFEFASEGGCVVFS